MVTLEAVVCRAVELQCVTQSVVYNIQSTLIGINTKIYVNKH